MRYFPRALPDELLGSLVGRACRETGLSLKALLFRIAGLRTTYDSIFLPSYIKPLSAVMRCDTEELLFSHTCFPYIVRFMSAAAGNSLKARVLSRDAIAGTSFQSLTQSVTFGVERRRRCQVCVKEDVIRFGTSYWHRSHLLPGVYYCVKHHYPLEETPLRITHRGGVWSYLMPHEVDGVRVDFTPPVGLLLEIALRSADALQTQDHYLDSWTGFYRRLAVEKGYAPSLPFNAAAQIAIDLRAGYSEGFLDRARCNFSTSLRRPWPALMMRPNTEMPFVPVKHILLWAFLNNCNSAKKAALREKP